MGTNITKRQHEVQTLVRAGKCHDRDLHKSDPCLSSNPNPADPTNAANAGPNNATAAHLAISNPAGWSPYSP